MHLTDWPALENAVPSKTYELMYARLHISGVVQGEAARLIEQFSAGHIVSPENPEALANLWVNLAENRDSLMVSDKARQWVIQEAKVSSPLRLQMIIDRAAP